MMKTTIQEENNNQVVYFEGRLDTSASSQVQMDVQPLINDIKSDIILNCEKLDYISSSGLRIFLSILKSAKSLQQACLYPGTQHRPASGVHHDRLHQPV